MTVEESVVETEVENTENPGATEEGSAASGDAGAVEPGLTADAVVEKPVPTLAEKLAGLKEKADAKKAGGTGEVVAPAAGAATAVETNADGSPKIFKPNFEVEIRNADGSVKKDTIPEKLQKYVKDAESEKEIRDLYTHAKGVDFMKTRLGEATQRSVQLSQENASIKQSVDELRGIYQGAVKSGNWHRLDLFFDKLEIPHMHVLQYAMEKAKLAEMQPEQRAIVESRIEADRRAETLAHQQAGANTENMQMAQQIKQLQVETTLAQPEVAAMKAEFEVKTGQPGSFLALMKQYGELAWHQSRGQLNLTPRQVIDQIAKDFGLTGTAATPVAATTQPAATPAVAVSGAPVQSAVPGKPIVQRTATVIPNVQGKGGSSPLKAKPKSVEDLQAAYKEMVAAERQA